MIKFHSFVLINCSVIGFTGHYLQFGIARLTPWIPAAAGLTILVLHLLFENKKSFLKYLPLLAVLGFGLLTTNMCIKFLPQEFQPVRKKIIFCLMSFSAWVTIICSVKTMLREEDK